MFALIAVTQFETDRLNLRRYSPRILLKSVNGTKEEWNLKLRSMQSASIAGFFSVVFLRFPLHFLFSELYNRNFMIEENEKSI